MKMEIVGKILVHWCTLDIPCIQSRVDSYVICNISHHAITLLEMVGGIRMSATSWVYGIPLIIKHMIPNSPFDV